MPSGKLSTWRKARDGNSTSLSASSLSRKAFQNSPTSGRRISRRLERIADAFDSRQGRDALLLTERAFPISVALQFLQSNQDSPLNAPAEPFRLSRVSPRVKVSLSRTSAGTPSFEPPGNEGVSFTALFPGCLVVQILPGVF
jgi:hypothetical protein